MTIFALYLQIPSEAQFQLLHAAMTWNYEISENSQVRSRICSYTFKLPWKRSFRYQTLRKHETAYLSKHGQIMTIFTLYFPVAWERQVSPAKTWSWRYWTWDDDFCFTRPNCMGNAVLATTNYQDLKPCISTSLITGSCNDLNLHIWVKANEKWRV